MMDTDTKEEDEIGPNILGMTKRSESDSGR